MSAYRFLLVLLTIVFMADCSDEVILRSPDGATVLRYRCEQPQPRASSKAEQELVRHYVVRIVQREDNAGNPERVEEFRVAYDSNDPFLLERAVVDYLCDERVSDLELREVPFPHPGSLPPAFALPLAIPAPDLDSIVDLENLRGQVVLLEFGSSWCKPCRDRHPDLVRLHEEYGPAGLALYGVIHRDSPGRVQAWLR